MNTEKKVGNKDTVGRIAILLLLLAFVSSIISYFIQTVSDRENSVQFSIVSCVLTMFIPIMLIVLRNKSKILFIICNILLTCELIAVILMPLNSVAKIPSFMLMSELSYWTTVSEIFIKSWSGSIIVIIGLLIVVIDAVKKIRKYKSDKEQAC